MRDRVMEGMLEGPDQTEPSQQQRVVDPIALGPATTRGKDRRQEESTVAEIRLETCIGPVRGIRVRIVRIAEKDMAADEVDGEGLSSVTGSLQRQAGLNTVAVPSVIGATKGDRPSAEFVRVFGVQANRSPERETQLV